MPRAVEHLKTNDVSNALIMEAAVEQHAASPGVYGARMISWLIILARSKNAREVIYDS